MDIPRTSATKSPSSNIASSPAALFLSAFSSPSSSSLSLSNSYVSPNPYTPPPDAEGQVVSGYTLGTVIGYGSTSVIRLATSSSGGVVACKIVKNSPKNSTLRKEASIWSSLSHEHVLPLFAYHFISPPGQSYAFFFTLYCPAGTLFDILQNAKRQRAQESGCDTGAVAVVGGLNQDDAGMLFRQVVRGLRYMHTVVRYVHRDIKLENVLVDEQGHCRITDFGMARRIGSRSGFEDCSSSDESDSAEDVDDESANNDGEDEGIVALTRTASLTIPRRPQVLSPHQHILNRHLSFRRNTHSMSKADSLPSRSRRRNTTDVSKPLGTPRKVQPGSLPYAAPELLMPPAPLLSSAEYVMSQQESKSVAEGVHPAQDIWALGVLLYVLLTGRFPFSDAFEPRLQMKILHGAYDIPQGLGRAAEQVLRGCLERSITVRWTVDQVDEAGWGVGWGVEGDRALAENAGETGVESDATVKEAAVLENGRVMDGSARSVSAEGHPFIYNVNVDKDVEKVQKALRVDVSAPIERTRPCLSALHDSIFRGPSSSMSPASGNVSASRSSARNLFVDVLSPASAARDDDSALLVSPLPLSASMTLPSLPEGHVDEEAYSSFSLREDYDAHQSRSPNQEQVYPRTPDRKITSPLPLSPLKGFGIPPTPALSSVSFVGVSSPALADTSALHASTSIDTSSTSSPLTYKLEHASSPSHPNDARRQRNSSSELRDIGGVDDDDAIIYERGRSLRKVAHDVTESRSPSPSVQPKTPVDINATFTSRRGGTTRSSSGRGSESPALPSAVEALEMLQQRDTSRGRSPYVRLRQPGDVLHALQGGLGIISRSDSGTSDSSSGLDGHLKGSDGWKLGKAKDAIAREVSQGVYSSDGSSSSGRLFSPDRSSDLSRSMSPSSPSGRFAHSLASGFGLFSKDVLDSPASESPQFRGRTKGESIVVSKVARRAGSTPPTTVSSSLHAHHHHHHHHRHSHLQPHMFVAGHHWPPQPLHTVSPFYSHSQTPHAHPHHHLPSNGHVHDVNVQYPHTPLATASSSGQHTPSVVPMKSAPAQVVTVRVPILGQGTGVGSTRSRSLGPV